MDSGNTELRLKLAPLPVMMIGGLLYLVLLYFSMGAMRDQPWIGIEFRATEAGKALITAVEGDGPAAGKVGAGSVVKGLVCGGGRRVDFNALTFIQDPEETPDYGRYAQFFRHQAELDSCLIAGALRLSLHQGVTDVITPLAKRPLSEIPLGYWLTHLIGFSTLVFGLGIWTHRRGEVSSRLLALWAIAITVIVHSMSVYGFRELALDAELFRLVHKLNRFAVMMMGFTILTLICYYPRPLGRFPYAAVLLSLGLLMSVNESVEFVQWPLHTFYVPLMLVYLFSIILLIIQWRRSREDAMDRAAMIWFMLSIVLTNGGSLGFYALPAVLGETPLTPLWVGQGFFLLLFFGFALGVVRYRLFEVERWWLMTWVWFLGGLLVLLLDTLMVLYLNLQPAGALSIAVLIVAWAYLPARQWLWVRLFRRNDYRLETYLPMFVDAQLTSPTGEGFISRWPKFLAQVFHSSDVTLQPGEVTMATVVNNGCDLLMPALDGKEHVVLSGKERGSRLFTRDDIRLAAGLIQLARRTLESRKEQERMVNAERQRIMRDLHDDVGAQLLALVHLSESRESADIARQTLKSLREMVYAFRDGSGIPLFAALASWREEVMRRANTAGVELSWHQQELPRVKLSSRQRINLGSILREAVTNALKHPRATLLQVDIMAKSDQLYMKLANNGAEELSPPEQWRGGAGLANMITRAGEIDGNIEWKRSPDHSGVIIMSLKMPLTNT